LTGAFFAPAFAVESVQRGLESTGYRPAPPVINPGGGDGKG